MGFIVKALGLGFALGLHEGQPWYRLFLFRMSFWLNVMRF